MRPLTLMDLVRRGDPLIIREYGVKHPSPPLIIVLGATRIARDPEGTFRVNACLAGRVEGRYLWRILSAEPLRAR